MRSSPHRALKSHGDTKKGNEKRPDETGALRFVAAWYAKRYLLVALWATLCATRTRWLGCALVDLPRRLCRDAKPRSNRAECQAFGITHLADMGIPIVIR
jgi:hypothetical protein